MRRRGSCGGFWRGWGMSVDFSFAKLSECAHIEMGQSPDSSYIFDNIDSGIPFLQGNAEFGDVFPCPRYSCTQPTKMCNAGDVLIFVRAPVGEINLADRSYCIGRGLAAIRIKGIDPILAAKIVEYSATALKRVMQGTTFEAVSKNDLLSLEVKIPPQNEMSVLTRCIESLDTTIRQTEAIIAKLQQVKQGLLHDLLTRGIDANGQLRPPVEQAPHLYKESPLGWIPREWEVASAETLLSRIIDYRGKTPTKTEVGVPLITAKNVRMGYIDPEPREFIAEIAYTFWMTRGIPNVDDVLFTTEAPLGNVAQIKTNDQIAFAQRVIILQSGPKLRSSFLKFVLMSEKIQRTISKLASGTTALGIKQSVFRTVLLPYPLDIKEQKLIEGKLEALDSYLRREQEAMSKLCQQKSALMDDLLTGRVRVTALLSSETPASEELEGKSA